MADTLPDVPLPKNTWVDLYAATGILVGTQIVVTNKGSSRIILQSKATTPTDLNGPTLAVDEDRINEVGDSGAWAYSENIEGKVNVRAA